MNEIKVPQIIRVPSGLGDNSGRQLCPGFRLNHFYNEVFDLFSNGSGPFPDSAAMTLNVHFDECLVDLMSEEVILQAGCFDRLFARLMLAHKQRSEEHTSELQSRSD